MQWVVAPCIHTIYRKFVKNFKFDHTLLSLWSIHMCALLPSCISIVTIAVVQRKVVDTSVILVSPWSLRRHTFEQDDVIKWKHFPRYWALSYYTDLTLSQTFQPMTAQLSQKAALPLAKILATASGRSSKTGPRSSVNSLHKGQWRGALSCDVFFDLRLNRHSSK